MISVAIKTKNGLITGFCISGHSGYSELGSDIVCASVSSAAFMTANTITDVMCLDADISLSDGFMSLELTQQNAEKASDILQGLKLHLTELSKQYKKYIKVIFSEV